MKQFFELSLTVIAFCITLLCNFPVKTSAHQTDGVVDVSINHGLKKTLDPGFLQSLHSVQKNFLKLGANHEQVDEEKIAFVSWMQSFGKQYATVAEMEERFLNWISTVSYVSHHNKRTDVDYTLEVNTYADMTEVEFNAYYHLDASGMLGKGQQCAAQEEEPEVPFFMENLSSKTLPEHVDWREKGVISIVKNQGHCGSCWTFSTTGALEAHHAMKTGLNNVLLSEQQLIDCAQAFHNMGCSGGLPSHAFEYVIANGGIDTEAAYPYHGKNGTRCLYKKDSMSIGATAIGVHNITQFDETELEYAVALNGPVSVAFQVAPGFRLYKSGVYESTTCKDGPLDVNHAVLAVGFGQEENGKKYWIIKNSWGPEWGESGYFKMLRGSNMEYLHEFAHMMLPLRGFIVFFSLCTPFSLNAILYASSASSFEMIKGDMRKGHNPILLIFPHAYFPSSKKGIDTGKTLKIMPHTRHGSTKSQRILAVAVVPTKQVAKTARMTTKIFAEEVVKTIGCFGDVHINSLQNALAELDENWFDYLSLILLLIGIFWPAYVRERNARVQLQNDGQFSNRVLVSLNCLAFLPSPDNTSFIPSSDRQGKSNTSSKNKQATSQLASSIPIFQQARRKPKADDDVPVIYIRTLSEDGFVEYFPDAFIRAVINDTKKQTIKEGRKQRLLFDEQKQQQVIDCLQESVEKDLEMNTVSSVTRGQRRKRASYSEMHSCGTRRSHIPGLLKDVIGAGCEKDVKGVFWFDSFMRVPEKYATSFARISDHIRNKLSMLSSQGHLRRDTGLPTIEEEYIYGCSYEDYKNNTEGALITDKMRIFLIRKKQLNRIAALAKAGFGPQWVPGVQQFNGGLNAGQLSYFKSRWLSLVRLHQLFTAITGSALARAHPEQRRKQPLQDHNHSLALIGSVKLTFSAEGCYLSDKSSIAATDPKYLPKQLKAARSALKFDIIDEEIGIKEDGGGIRATKSFQGLISRNLLRREKTSSTGEIEPAQSKSKTVTTTTSRTKSRKKHSIPKQIKE